MHYFKNMSKKIAFSVVVMRYLSGISEIIRRGIRFRVLFAMADKDYLGFLTTFQFKCVSKFGEFFMSRTSFLLLYTVNTFIGAHHDFSISKGRCSKGLFACFE